MIDTKEKILTASLELFAKNGYEAVSVSDIAGVLGITKGALYKHYKNKRDIFDSIVKRMYDIDAERSRRYGVPENTYEQGADEYGKTTVEDVKKFTAAQFEFWTEDSFASNFRKMLMLEQYRDERSAELYSACLTDGPIEYMRDIFAEMIKNGILKKSDPQLLAIEYYAPMYLLMNIANVAERAAVLKQYIDKFFKEKTNEIH